MQPDHPRVRSVEVNGVRLGYRDVGDPAGPVAVLLHGSGSDASTWDRFVARLTASGHRCVAVDLRGHASSSRSRDYSLNAFCADARHLLDALDLDGVTLVGHSVGGYAALAAARSVPDRIARLVLEDVAAPPRRPEPALPGVRDVARAAVAAFTILAQRPTFDLRAAASILRQVSRPDPGWWAGLDAVPHPTLVLSGGPTSCIPPQRLADLVDALPQAWLSTIPVGHRVHSLAPEEFADRVTAFLQGDAATPAPPAASTHRPG